MQGPTSQIQARGGCKWRTAKYCSRPWLLDREILVFGLWTLDFARTHTTYHQGSEARFPPGSRGRRFWISFFGIDLLTCFKYSGNRSVLTKSCQRLVGKWRDGSSIFKKQKNASFITRIYQIMHVHVPHTFLTHTKSLGREFFLNPCMNTLQGWNLYLAILCDTIWIIMELQIDKDSIYMYLYMYYICSYIYICNYLKNRQTCQLSCMYISCRHNDIQFIKPIFLYCMICWYYV